MCTMVWGPKDYGAQHGEGTDVQVAAGGASVVLSWVAS